MNKRTMRKGLVLVLALIMVFAMSTGAFADTTSWTSFQGNDQHNGVITGSFSTAPTWRAVQLLDATKTTGWSGVDCQPLMTTENGTTYAYVVSDSNEGAKAFKVNCNTQTIATGWEGGVALTDTPTAQLGTGTIVNDTWYLPVTYDYQILPNAYMSYNGGWSFTESNLTETYDLVNYSGLHFLTNKDGGGSATMISDHQTMPINVNVEDIWADFTIQFGSLSSAYMSNMSAQMYIKAENASEWISLGGFSSSEIQLGEEMEYSVNCTDQLKEAGMGGDKLYQLKLEFSFDSNESSEVIVKKAEVYKNNMFVKKIENISTATAPSATTMVDYHTYGVDLDGGRGGQLNTPMLYLDGNLFFGKWTRGDAYDNDYGKYYCLDVNNNQLSALDTGCTSDNFYLTGATTYEEEGSTYLIFGSENGNLYLFDADTVECKSIENAEDDIRSSICSCDDEFYFTTKAGKVCKYIVNDYTELEKVWVTPLALPSNATPTISDGVVYVSTGNYESTSGTLYAFDAETGNKINEYSVPGGPVQSSMLIYEAGEDSTYTYYTVNSDSGKGYCKLLNDSAEAYAIGEAGYTLQGFAAANGYLVYGNDGVSGTTGYTVSVYVAQ